MTDTEYEIEKARVQKYIEKWMNIVGLTDWDVIHYFFREPNEHNDNSPLTLATTNACWEYKRVAFNWYLQVVEEVSDVRLELHIVHELCHPLVDPLHEPDEGWDSKKLEYVTQSVALALLRCEPKRIET